MLRDEFEMVVDVNETLILCELDDYPDYLTVEHMASIDWRYTPEDYRKILYRGELPYVVRYGVKCVDAFTFARWFAVGWAIEDFCQVS